MGIKLSDADRPSPGIQGRSFFNTDDGLPNYDNGSDWVLPDGTVM